MNNSSWDYDIWREAIPKYECDFQLILYSNAISLSWVSLLLNANTALIKSNICSEALDLIVSNNPNTWLACKTILVNRFIEPSSENLLFNKLFPRYQVSFWVNDIEALNLAEGFQQIPVDNNSTKKRLFQFRIRSIALWIENAAATFQKMITLLMIFLHKICFVYMDVIVVFSKSI